MAAKKSFKGALQAEKEAAAAAFISQMGRDPEEEVKEIFPDGLAATGRTAEDIDNPPQKERKTERINLTITPQYKKDLKIMSFIERKSPTALINILVGEYLDKNRPKIDQFKELFGEGADDENDSE